MKIKEPKISKVDRDYLVKQVKQMIDECGNPVGFDAAKWVDTWLDTPNLRLHGEKPATWLDTDERSEYISHMLACIQSGAYF